jgi:hypothetical protein
MTSDQKRRYTDAAEYKQRLQSTIDDIFTVVNEVMRVWNVAQALPQAVSETCVEADAVADLIQSELDALTRSEVAGDIVRAHGLSISLV